MAKRVTQLQAEKVLDKYLAERELLLQKKVSALSLKLFDKVFEKYFKNILELSEEGKLVYNKNNISAVNGLDKVFKTFRDGEGMIGIRQFVTDALGLTELNTQYFKTITPEPVGLATNKAKIEVNKSLGLTEKGIPIKNGFVDKFIRDETLLKNIKKETVKAITQGKGFQQFRQDLKVGITGIKGQPLSGGLQQYYRNNAYDTLSKVDRLNAEVFAKQLKIKYFVWSGGIIKTTRELCRRCNAKIFNSEKLKEIKYFNLKDSCKNGVPNPWHPLIDLGGYACRHHKRYISDSSAMLQKDRWMNYNLIIR